MFTFEIVRSSQAVNLALQVADPNFSKIAEQRLVELVEVLEQILAADKANGEGASEEKIPQLQAVMAMDMKYQALLHVLLEQAKLSRSVAEGRESIASHGFPEF